MRFQFWSVGKPHEEYVKKGIEDFTRRVNNYFPVEWIIIPSPKNAASLPESDLKKQEAKLVLNKLNKEDFLVLLDENGRQFSSEELAQFISQKASDSTRLLIFLIGGAFGVSEEIRQRADFTWSLSKLVFPHMLVRLILAEQVYRACSILRNEKYHHS
jgi:23S rRNA (pseudouridine1915-N3)-methyltransferase